MRRLLVLAGLLAAVATGCNHHEDPAPPGCDLFASVSCLDAARIKADVDVLASPALAGRRAGRAGNALAATRIEAALSAAKLQHAAGLTGYRQEFGIWDWEPTAAPTLSLGGVARELGADYELIDFSASGTASGTLFYAGYGLALPSYDAASFPECQLPSGWNDFGAQDLTGKIVVITGGWPAFASGASRCPLAPECGGNASYCYGAVHRIETAYAHHASGVLFVHPHRTSYGPAPYPFARFDRDPSLPVLQLDRDVLDAVLPDASTWEAAIDGGTASPRDTPVRASLSVAGATTQKSVANVIAVVPGSDPVLGRQVVVIGSHFDHLGKLAFRQTWYPGADDNASGTAVTLEIARAVAASPTRPKRTLVFAFWNAEEWGLYGSWYYAYFAPGGPLYPIDATAAALSVDMVGFGAETLGLYDAGAPIAPLVAAAAGSARDLGLAGTVFAGGTEYGSDHTPFAYYGLPAADAMTGATLDAHPWYHTPQDAADTLSEPELGAAARLVWATIRPWALGTESTYLTSGALRATPARAPSRRLAPGFVVLE